MTVLGVVLSDNHEDQVLEALGPGGTGPSLAKVKSEGGASKLDRTNLWKFKD